jgi:hypothetical protein
MNKRIWLLSKIERAEMEAIFYKPPSISKSLGLMLEQVMMMYTTTPESI